MAYRGAIDYLDLPFAGVDWVEQAIVSPWRHQSSDVETWHGPPSTIELSARVQNFTGVPLNLMDSQANGFNVIYDIPARVPRDTKEIKCVVLGRLKITMSPNEPRHVVMLVLKDEHRRFYRRIGVGIVPGASISFKEAVLEVRIR
jgi:hypothetical protein